MKTFHQPNTFGHQNRRHSLHAYIFLRATVVNIAVNLSSWTQIATDRLLYRFEFQTGFVSKDQTIFYGSSIALLILCPRGIPGHGCATNYV